MILSQYYFNPETFTKRNAKQQDHPLLAVMRTHEPSRILGYYPVPHLQHNLTNHHVVTSAMDSKSVELKILFVAGSSRLVEASRTRVSVMASPHSSHHALGIINWWREGFVRRRVFFGRVIRSLSFCAEFLSCSAFSIFVIVWRENL
jgi:hypothetical protein